MDKFTEEYFRCAAWKRNSPNSLSTFNEAIEDCQRFQRDNHKVLQALYRATEYNERDTGQRFFNSRNRHGESFYHMGVEAGRTLHSAAIAKYISTEHYSSA